MSKIILFTIGILFWLIFPSITSAASSSYVSIVNPVRGSDFQEPGFDLSQTVKQQQQLLQENRLNSTWLLRYDVLKNPELLSLFQQLPAEQETGLFLEITPTFTGDAGVTYRQSESWHSAGSVFLTGYEVDERRRLIDRAFEQYKTIFGSYPTSVGAWWIDAGSLEYMEEKYGITASLMVADQYSTDNYQIWGQYFGYPYYPMKRAALFPAQTEENKIPIVTMQWAARDPINGYGKGVEESTYSVQANDYIDYHPELGIDYFNSLVDLYTKQPLNQINQIVVGLENSYSWDKYGQEYTRQIESLVNKQRQGQLRLVSMRQFSQLYKQAFPGVSPSQIMIAKDPLGSEREVVWWMNPYYRAGWFGGQAGAILVDLHQYVAGQDELCLEKVCQSINFATTASRVLDSVTHQQEWILDSGQVSQIEVRREGDKGVIDYVNAANQYRMVEFLARDIAIDGRVYSIDAAILYAKQLADQYRQSVSTKVLEGTAVNQGEWIRLGWQLILFIGFLVVGAVMPGRWMVRQLVEIEGARLYFLGTVVGLVVMTLVGLITYGLGMPWLMWGWLILGLVSLIVSRFWRWRVKGSWWWVLIIGLGTLFQMLPVWRSGLVHGYGVGFWGPNGHDGIWHLALIEQLTKGLPPTNPTYGGEMLVNYHYLYDLMVAITHNLTMIGIGDLVWRFFPLLFSVMLGVGTVVVMRIWQARNSAIIWGLIFVYFGGSFGWIVSLIKGEQLGGESAFWANQAISFNLNPPFAISLIILIGIMIWLTQLPKSRYWFSGLGVAFLVGPLVGFKAYAAILAIAALGLVGLWALIRHHRFEYLLITFCSVLISILVIWPTFGLTGVASGASSTFIYSPWWFVHSMIDFNDRVGWMKLSSARMAYFERGEWWKWGLVESIGLGIFIIGNLGWRILAIGSVTKIKQLMSTPAGQFCFWVGLGAMVIPIFFIQSGTAWNTIQFSYYGLYLIGLAAGVTLGSIWYRWPKVLVVITYLGLLVMVPISSMTTAWGYLIRMPHAYISNQELAGLAVLRGRVDGVVLSYPYKSELRENLSDPFPLYAYDATNYVSAFSGKPSFVADQAQNEILGTDYLKRVGVSQTVLDRPSTANRGLLDQNGIRYIYLLKVYGKTINEEALGVKKIYENDEVLVYETI